MPFYSDSEAYYTNMRTLFACVQENYPRATETIGKSKINIRIHTTGPAADITILGRETPVRTTFGENGVKPDLEIEMAADTFHKILLGDLSLKTALGNSQLKVKGPIWKAMSLGDLFMVSRKCYPDIIAGEG
jgi:putative sterol carrier protein